MVSEAGPYLGVPALLSLRIPKPPENEAVWYLHSTGTICGCKHPNYEARLERICAGIKLSWSFGRARREHLVLLLPS